MSVSRSTRLPAVALCGDTHYHGVLRGFAAPPVAIETISPFAVALRELVVEHDYVTRNGTPNWSAFAAQLEGIHYETLRRTVAGKQQPSPRLIEECARLLQVRPEYFLEYRIYLAQRDFDPRTVGLDRVVQNLRAWAKFRDDAAAG
jgi:hypothetical protein